MRETSAGLYLGGYQNRGALQPPTIAHAQTSNDESSLYMIEMPNYGAFPHRYAWQKSGVNDNVWSDMNLASAYITDFDNAGDSYRLRVTDASGVIIYSNIINTSNNSSYSNYDIKVPTTGTL